jgi:hypothetical protein
MYEEMKKRIFLFLKMAIILISYYKNFLKISIYFFVYFRYFLIIFQFNVNF